MSRLPRQIGQGQRAVAYSANHVALVVVGDCLARRSPNWDEGFRCARMLASVDTPLLRSRDRSFLLGVVRLLLPRHVLVRPFEVVGDRTRLITSGV